MSSAKVVVSSCSVSQNHPRKQQKPSHKKVVGVLRLHLLLTSFHGNVNEPPI